jgi:ribosomal protein S18 acetylase RimI-like enzyme
MEIRALRESDDRSAFHSGEPDLDRFLRKYAGQNQFPRHIGATHAAVQGGRVAGYVTVAPGHIEIEDLPVAQRKKAPRYPPPVLRLARLAVDESVRGRGLGDNCFAPCCSLLCEWPKSLAASGSWWTPSLAR